MVVRFGTPRNSLNKNFFHRCSQAMEIESFLNDWKTKDNDK